MSERTNEKRKEDAARPPGGRGPRYRVTRVFVGAARDIDALHEVQLRLLRPPAKKKQAA